MKLISVVVPCFNEEGNIQILYNAVSEIFSRIPQYRFELIFVDNASTDQSKTLVKKLCNEDSRVKLIANSRNFGYIKSSFYGILQASGDAIIYMAADMQDPPELILEFIKRWEAGIKIVIGVKNKSQEGWLMFKMRKLYYRLIRLLSDDVEQIANFTGFGLYDVDVIKHIRKFEDMYPYFRGIVSEVGFDKEIVYFTQPIRKNGKTNFSFFRLYSLAMTGLVNYTKFPIRFITFVGFICSLASMLVSVYFVIYKIIFWDKVQLGIATLIAGLFFFSSMQMMFLGLIGEYVGAVWGQVRKRPLVIERYRINFDKTPNELE